MPRPPSQADHELEERLRARGVELPARTIQTYRQVGLLPTPDRSWPGGGGSTGRYPDAAVEQAVEAMELAAEYPKAFSMAVAAMYGRGNFHIPAQKLKRALLHIVDRFEDWISSAAGADAETTDPVTVALRAAPRLARRVSREPELRELRRRIKRGQEPRESVLASVVANAAAIFLTGAPVTEDGGLEAISLLVPGAVDDLDPPVDLETFFSGGAAEFTRETIRAASLEELESARDDYSDVVRWATLALEVLPVITGEDVKPMLTALIPHDDFGKALGAINLLRLKRLWPDELDSELQAMGHARGELRAIHRVMEELPDRLHPLMGPDRETFAKTLTSADREVIEQSRQRFRDKYPLDAQLLDKLKEQ